MKREGDTILSGKNLFSLDRLQSNQNFEGGTNLTVGLNEIVNDGSEASFTVGQIINEKKNNKNMPDTLSLDKRFSDIVEILIIKSMRNFR